MRLVRRTLLCLVVGVTAFGVAGWLLRPKPRWTAHLRDGDCMFGGGRNSRFDDAAPVWITYFRSAQDREGTEFLAAEAFDAETGSRRTRVDLKRAWRQTVIPEGDLFTATVESKEDANSTVFHHYRPEASEAVGSFQLKGRWVLDFGRFARRVERTRTMATIAVADLLSGKIVATRTVAGDHERYDEDLRVSEDSRWAAAGEQLQRRSNPRGIELIDLLSGTSRYLLPPGESQPPEWGAYGKVDFSEDSRTIAFSFIPIHSDAKWSRWRFTIETGRYERLPLKPPSPAPFPLDVDGEGAFDYEKMGDIWAAFPQDREDLWFCVERDGQVVLPWRQVPFTVADARVISYGAFRQVPGRSELVTALHEPNLVNQLPVQLRQRPPFADLPGVSARWRWHDWERNVWHDIGATSGDRYPQLRAKTLFTRASGTDGPVLQSWPLPPRDPKPPALAIAALCMAATWWLCAWRYRRRTRLASIGAA